MGRGKKKKYKRRGKKASYKGGDKDLAGIIFMCDSATRKDCFKYHVFGFPESQKDLIERARKGIKLFLFDLDKKVLYGIYKASSLGGMNLVSEAFQDSGRKFPAQIRFSLHKDYAPLDESAFRPVISEDYHGGNKFKCELSSEQVHKLTQLFRVLDASGQPEPKPVIGKESRQESFHQSSISQGPRTGASPLGPPAGQYPRSLVREPLPIDLGMIGKESRQESFHQSSISQGPRTGASPLGPPAGQYPWSLVREPLPIELGLRSQPGYIPPAHSLSYPDIGRLETDALYRQRLQAMQMQDVRADAMQRRPYAMDPLLDASLRQAGVEFGRRRFPDDLHVDERSLLLSKGSSLHEDLYRGTPYQRDVLYSGQDNVHAFSGTLPYKPSTTLPWGYP